MDERVRFVARLLDGEKMAGLCRSSISRARPATRSSSATRTSASTASPTAAAARTGTPTSCRIQVETLIVRLKREHPSLGRAEDPGAAARLYDDVQTPAISTVHAVLDRHGLVTRRNAAAQGQGTSLSRPRAQRAVVRRLQGRVHARRPPLLLSAHHHRLRQPLSVRLRGPGDHQETYAFTVFERVFKEFGLPKAIRTDNGVPFASPHALFGLSKLVGLVAALGDRDRTHQARPSAAERPSRAHAPDA